MKITRWLMLAPLDFFMSNVLAYLVAPFVACFSDAAARRLFPSFVTPDNPVTGDAGHEARWVGYPSYMKKVAWLWRNRAYGFSASVLKAQTAGPVAIEGSARVSNRPLYEGRVLRWTPEGYWQWYYVRRNPLYPKRCIRINLGWKLWDAPGHSMFGQYVLSINPVSGYSE
jgi:hypothetical protein